MELPHTVSPGRIFTVWAVASAGPLGLVGSQKDPAAAVGAPTACTQLHQRCAGGLCVLHTGWHTSELFMTINQS